MVVLALLKWIRLNFALGVESCKCFTWSEYNSFKFADEDWSQSFLSKLLVNANIVDLHCFNSWFIYLHFYKRSCDKTKNLLVLLWSDSDMEIFIVAWFCKNLFYMIAGERISHCSIIIFNIITFHESCQLFQLSFIWNIHWTKFKALWQLRLLILILLSIHLVLTQDKSILLRSFWQKLFDWLIIPKLML